jgi:CHAD domain-containing protein
LRIGLRRLRTATALFDAMLADDEQPRLEGELKWLAREMDAHRDLDVFVHGAFRPAARALGQDGLGALGGQLLAAKSRAFARSTQAVRSERYRALVLDLAAWIEAGAWTRGEDPHPATQRAVPIKEASIGALDHLHHLVCGRGRNLDRLDPRRRHKLRIAAKRLRYASEFFAPLHAHRRRQADFLSKLKRMQDQLGALNDIAVARERLLSEGGLNGAPLAFAAGRIVGWRERDEPRLMRAAVKGYQAFSAVRPFWT